jgi:hypothetical protein
MFKSLLISALLNLSLIPQQSSPPCEKPPLTGSPNWGHITSKVLEKRPIKKIQGRVLDPLGQPIPNAYVYIWRMPMHISDENFSSVRFNRDRILDCQTGEGGRFRIGNLRSGKYVVCATMRGMNSTCVLITLKPESKRKGFDIVLEVGT